MRFVVHVTETGFPYVCDTQVKPGIADEGFPGKAILGGSVDSSPDGTAKSRHQADVLNGLAEFSHSPLSLATVIKMVEEQRRELEKKERKAYDEHALARLRDQIERGER
jgi:hypothetical protein